jgi:hypothetical protein
MKRAGAGLLRAIRSRSSALPACTGENVQRQVQGREQSMGVALRPTTLGPPADMRMDGHAPTLESAQAQLGESWRKWLAWAKLAEIEA